MVRCENSYLCTGCCICETKCPPIHFLVINSSHAWILIKRDDLDVKGYSFAIIKIISHNKTKFMRGLRFLIRLIQFPRGSDLYGLQGEHPIWIDQRHIGITFKENQGNLCTTGNQQFRSHLYKLESNIEH